MTIKKEDRDKAIEYMKEVRGLYTDNMSDEIIEYLVDGYTETLDWFDSIGGQNYEVKVDPEYPDFVNADVICKCYTGDNYNFWPVVRRAAMSRRDDKLQIWFSTPCEKMIQDPVSKEILGVQVTRNKETLNLRATRGGILAAGGFEASNDRYLAQMKSSKDDVMLLAKENGKIIGTASLNRLPRRMSHRGDFSISVLKEY